MNRPRPLPSASSPVDERYFDRKVERVIAGALKSCIHAHGPISDYFIGSAVKRIKGELRGQGLLVEDQRR